MPEPKSSPRRRRERPLATVEGHRPPAESSPRPTRGPAVDRPAPRELRPVQKVRTQHGTRVAVRVTCTSCGGDDVVSFAPRTTEGVLCRKCAFEQFGMVDGDEVSLQMRRQPCSVCRRTQELRFDPTGQSRPVCDDCRAGIEVRPAERTKRAVRLSSGVIRARPAKDTASEE